MTVSMYKISVPIFVQFLTASASCSTKRPPIARPRRSSRRRCSMRGCFPTCFRWCARCARRPITPSTPPRGLPAPSRSHSPTPRQALPSSSERLDQGDRLRQRLQTGADRRQRGQGDQDHVPERRDARFHRTVTAARKFAAELLFPLHHGLRHPAPLRRRSRQARFHGDAGHPLAPARKSVASARTASQRGREHPLGGARGRTGAADAIAHRGDPRRNAADRRHHVHRGADHVVLDLDRPGQQRLRFGRRAAAGAALTG